MTAEADLLRRASGLMRDRAEAAVVFRDAHSGEPLPWVKGLDGMVFDMGATPIASSEPEQAEHIASWHPAVALAVADWLDITAQDVGSSTLSYRAALAAARAYVGAL